MVKLDSIRIKNYKNIREADLSLSSFNVLVGPNNSGKSNFIQIISFLNFIINGAKEQVEISFKSGYFGKFGRIHNLYINETQNIETLIELKFHNDNNFKYTYLLILHGKKIEDKISFKIYEETLNKKNIENPGIASTIFKRNENGISYGKDFSKTQAISDIPPFASVIRFLGIMSEKTNPYYSSINDLNIILKAPTFYFSITERESEKEKNDREGRTIGYDLQYEISKLHKSASFNIFQKFLKDSLDITKIEPLKIGASSSEEREYIFITHLNHFKHINNLSDGSYLLVSLVAKILSSDNDFYLIEEPENSLHPKVLVDLIRFLRSFELDKQFLIATHSITIINEVLPKNVLIAKIDKNGCSEISNISDDKQLKKKLKSGYVDFSDNLFFKKELYSEFEDV